MKAEITQENKAKLFAQYYPQKILHHVDYEDYCPVGFSGILDINYYANNDYYLSLKPLSSICNEDAIEVFGFDNFFEYSKDNNHRYFNKSASEALLDTLLESHLSLELNAYSVDFLRSKGYAVDWIGLTVQEMIEAGWIKLIEK